MGAEPKSEWRRRKGLVLRVGWVRRGGGSNMGSGN